MQASTFLVDVFMLGGFLRALSTEGRMDTSGWRGDDWANVGGYAVLALVRAAFVAGVGLRQREPKGKSA